MTTPQKFDAIVNAMEFKKWDDGKEGYAMKEDFDKKENEEVYTELLRIIYDENVGGVHDLSYEIVCKATGVIEEIGLKDLHNDNAINEADNEHASVYTYPRLQYLNINNQQEITDTLKEYDCDIQTACAIWYDNQVRDTAETLRAFILK